jgi:putative endonuclease
MSGKKELRLGARGEDAAANHLAERGYAVLARNYRKRFGEVDIVAQKDGVLVFVEVKTRSSARFGTPAEAVDARKRRRISAAALSYVSEHGLQDTPARFDVIEVLSRGGKPSIVHIQDAFAFEEPI